MVTKHLLFRIILRSWQSFNPEYRYCQTIPAQYITNTIYNVFLTPAEAGGLLWDCEIMGVWDCGSMGL